VHKDGSEVACHAVLEDRLPEVTISGEPADATASSQGRSS
jgi:hypothetical protein